MQPHDHRLILALSLGLMLPASAAVQAEEILRCESQQGGYTYCQAAQAGEGMLVLHRQLSSNDCVYQETWGHKDNGVWVDKGCRAEFTTRTPPTVSEETPDVNTMVITESLEEEANASKKPTDKPATVEVGADYQRPVPAKEQNPLVDSWQHNRSLPSILRIQF